MLRDIVVSSTASSSEANPGKMPGRVQRGAAPRGGRLEALAGARRRPRRETPARWTSS